MRVLKTLLSLAFLLIPSPALGGEDWKAFNVGNVWCAVYNTGVIGYPTSPTANPSMWWPAGTNDSYLYEGDIWIGAIKKGVKATSETDKRHPEFWPTDDSPVVRIQTPGMTRKGTKADQVISFRCTDTNPAQNKGVILNILIEAMGYQWSYPPLWNFFIMEYRIRNIGDPKDPDDILRDLYIGFRYDCDVSSNEKGTADYSADDWVDFDLSPDANTGRPRNISFVYSNGTAPGYIGLRVLGAYMGNDRSKVIPFRAHRQITINTDPTTDEQRFDLLSIPGIDPKPASYGDQRFVQSWGPIREFAPGDEFTITIAVGVGEGLAGLRSDMDWAQKIYDKDYVVPAPPPSPKLTVIPGDKKVTLYWDGTEAELYRDPTDPEKAFEGYRVYRKSVSYDPVTGKQKEVWILLADYDVVDNTGNYFLLSHPSMATNAVITSRGIAEDYRDRFGKGEYIIMFRSPTELEVWNVSTWEFIHYNPKNYTEEGDGSGFTILDPSGNPRPFPVFSPGDTIYLAGLLLSISPGDRDPMGPGSGDVFKVSCFVLPPMGQNTGIRRFFVDTGLTNGMKYTYAVTSYDTGNPRTGLVSMESSKNDTMTTAIPRSDPAGYKGPEVVIGGLERGPDISVEPIVLDPKRVTGHRYIIKWSGASGNTYIGGPGYKPPSFELIDLDTKAVLLKDVEFPWFDPEQGAPFEMFTPIFDGIVLFLKGADAREAKVESFRMTGGWADVEPDSSNELSGADGTTSCVNPFWVVYFRPHRYSIRFGERSADGSYTISVRDETSGEEVPFNPGRADGWAVMKMTPSGDFLWADSWNPDAPFFRIYVRGAYLHLRFPNPKSHGLDTGDVLTAVMSGPRAPMDGDIVEISTAKERVVARKEALEAIKVVPNPYFVSARWDERIGRNRIYFTHLPPKCTIRIYTISGDLVAKLEHDSSSSPDPDDPFVKGDRGGDSPYDVLSYDVQALASGVYIYHVDAPGFGEKIGKFAIIR
jgi:hypothetical protein